MAASKHEKRRPDDYVWVQLDCPVCGLSFSLSKLAGHRDKHHAGMSVQALERAIADALKARTLVYTAHALGPPQRVSSPTSLLREKSRYLKMQGSKALEGGAWGLKKK